MQRKVVLYIAMSLDGYIAKHDDNIDFLSLVETPGEDYGYNDFLQGVDTVIWGRKTFDKVVSFGQGIPHHDKKVYVISSGKTGTEEHVIFHNDPVSLVRHLLAEEGKDIYCDGGASLVHTLLAHQLIDRLIISVIPHLLGDGIRLFTPELPEQKLRLKRSLNYPSGLVQLWYDVAGKE